MKRCYRGMFGALAVVLLSIACSQAKADTKQNPYETIVDRNPFGLKPPPPPPDPSTNPPPAVAAPPATVDVTGITDILGNKRALLEIVPGPGKPMIKPILAEGERVESVEVVAINMAKNEVTIRNGSLVTNLTFKVIKPTAVVAAANPLAPPGVPPINTGVAQPNLSQLSGGRNNVMVSGGAPSVQNNATGADGFRSIPSRNIRTTGAQGTHAPVSAEEQYIMTEINRNNHGLPVPPTPLNPNPQYPRAPAGTPGQGYQPNLPNIPGYGGNP